MKTLVTGGTGLIGSSVVRELLDQGREVKLLLLKGCDTSNIKDIEKDIEIVEGDITDKDSVKSALDGCGILYQMAALYAMWAPDPGIFYKINVEGSTNVLEAAMEKGVEKVVYTSSIAAVGAYGPDIIADENSEFNLWETGDHYVRTKYLGELEARKYIEKGLPVVMVCPCVTIGERDVVPTPSGKSLLDVLNGKAPAYVDGGLNIVDVEDVAKGHVLAEEKGRLGERYILGNKNITIKDYMELIAKIAGVDPPKFKMPYSALLAIGYICQTISKITKKEPVATASTARMGSQYMYYDCSKAIKELGLPQTPIEETIQKAINWFRENGYVKNT